MNILWDTHTFLWFISGHKDLSKVAKVEASDPQKVHFLSIASLWEVSIKTAIGKLEINGPYASVIDDVLKNQIQILPISFEHTVIQNKLPFHERDPFDRIIASQCIAENMNLISKDDIFDKYFENSSVKRIW